VGARSLGTSKSLFEYDERWSKASTKSRFLQPTPAACSWIVGSGSGSGSAGQAADVVVVTVVVVVVVVVVVPSAVVVVVVVVVLGI